MDFSLNEEQEQVRRLARDIFTRLATPARLREAEALGDFFDRPLWDALARAGLLGAALPEEYGGAGLGFLGLCALLEEQGRAAAMVPIGATLLLGALPVARFGTEAQRRRLLPGVVAGTTVLSAALVEEVSADPTATRAEPDGSGWRLFGVKTCVPAAHLAERVLVPARTAGGHALCLLDPRAEGVSLERQRATTGEPLHRMALSGARVEGDDVLPGGGAALGWLVERARAGLCIIESGVAQRQLELLAEHTTRRQQFGRPIASFQAVGQRAADAFIAVEAVRLTAWQAAWRLDAGLPAAEAVAVAKYWAAEGGQRVAHAAQHLHGGMGFDRSYPLYRYYLWARQIELGLGGAATHLAHLGALLAQEPQGPEGACSR